MSDRQTFTAALLCPLLFLAGWLGGSRAGHAPLPAGAAPTTSVGAPSTAVGTRGKDAWAPLAPSAKLSAPAGVWDVLSHPDQFVGVTTTISGYLVAGFEFAQLAHTAEEVRTFDRWRAERPGEHPRLRLLGLDLADVELPAPRASLHGRRLSITGTIKPPYDPLEPNPVLRWAHGVSMEVKTVALLP